jgi:cephalosporin hydroxylase
MAMIRQGLKVKREEGLWAFLRQTSSYIYSYYLSAFLMPFVVRKFKSASGKANSIQDEVKLAFSFRFLGICIKPHQIEPEISRFIEIVAELKPRHIIEIGTADGGVLFLFSRVASPKAVMISVDLRNLRCRRPLYKSFEENQQTIHLLRANSHTDTTVRAVKEILNGAQLDLLFIDGDHTYDGVKEDFVLYSPLVRDGGLIAFHDIVKFPPKAIHEEVSRFWSEIRDIYAGSEIINSPNQGGYGIGVVKKGERKTEQKSVVVQQQVSATPSWIEETNG